MDLLQPVKNVKKTNRRVFSEYKCETCSKRFSDKSGLAKHRATHSAAAPYACARCAYAGKTRQYLRRHVRTAHGTKKFSCETCGKTFHYGCKLKDHMRVHTGEKPHKCGVCEKAFNSSYSLNTHKLIHTNSKPYECSYCPYACRDSSTLRKHQARHTGSVTYYQCSVCDVSCKSKANLKVHVAERHLAVDVRRLECDACGKRFKFRNALVNHIRAVHEKSKSGKCEVCGLVISNRHNLRYHMRIHVDERPFVCTVEGCGKRYKHTSSLQHHTTTHFPAQFPCHICGKSFTREKRMRAHTKTHAAKVKNVECDRCGVRFYNKNYLARHVRRKHDRKRQRYVCDMCQFVTSNKPSLVMHIKYGHGDNNVHICAICEKEFKRDFNLKLHYWKEHEVEYYIPRERKRRKNKKTVVEVKEEPSENIDDGADVEYLHVSPKTEPQDDGIDEFSKTTTSSAGNQNDIEGIQKDAIEAFITPVLKGPDNDRRLKYSKYDFVDSKSERQVKIKVNRLMKEAEEKMATRALERAGREYKRHIRKAATVTTEKAHKRKIYPKNCEESSNSLLVEDYSINQTIDSKDRIIDKATIDNIVQNGIEHTETQEIDRIDRDNIIEKERDNLDVRKENKVRKNYAEDKSINIDDEDIDKGDTDDETSSVHEEAVRELGRNRKLRFNTHQCYVCFKLYQTKEELLEHCKDHFDLCNIKTLKKCPLCDYATNLSVTSHLKRKHKITVKVPYGNITENNQNEGSKYYYEVNDERIKKVEIIPSIKNLNKRASNKIDKINREKKNKNLVKNKLVKKGKEWIVMTEKMNVNDYLLPKSDKMESKNVKSGYLDRLKDLYKVAKKEGKKMLFPCDSCEKICQTLCGLKLHGRKHETNPKPFKPKIWKHKNNKPNDTMNDKNDDGTNDTVNNKNDKVISKDNRTAAPKPVVNNHKCEKELIEFYERNIKGGDVEFWQFLKIYNKMGRENINDFDDLQKSNSFGLHYNNEPEETSNNNTENNTNNVDIRNATGKKPVKIRNTRNAFTRVIRLSNKELTARNEAIKRLREKMKQNNR